MSSNQYTYKYLIEKTKQEARLSFSEFMEFALYHKEYGYYNKKEKIFAKEGDFTTSPITSTLFGECICQEFINISKYLESPSVIEIGGGDASLAISMLEYLQNQNCLPTEYIIIETSDKLVKIQEHNIKDKIPNLLNLVKWKKNISDTSIEGLVIANEFFDALPSERFKFNGKDFLTLYVEEKNNVLQNTWDIITSEQKKELDIAIGNPRRIFPKNYTSEFNMNYRKWISLIDKTLNKGLVLIIDYGYNSFEYYLDDRKTGTLVCNHKHNANFDPFEKIGEQDISTFVNFSHISRILKDKNLNVSGYLTQSNFLLNLGILEIFQKKEFNGDKREFELNKLKNILLPNTMGEIFKALILKKDFNENLLCIEKFNHLGKL
ncbi:MAG: SAM-dependent methyltransferase [Pseudomonadota bacterium]|nr:SAM-dependent methyltransferase [Pseudomonadota bacterium]